MKGTTISTCKRAKHASKLIIITWNKHSSSLNLSPISAKYSTKQNSIWINGGVTYRRTNAPNLSSKDGLSNEIEIHEDEQQEHEFFG